MFLLASGITSGNQIAVIVLCIAAVAFLLIDVFLVMSLHKHNKKLVRRKQYRVPEQTDEELITDDTENNG